MNQAQRLNGDANVRLDEAALLRALKAQGEAWYERMAGCFAGVPLFIDAQQLQKMKQVISAVGRVVNKGQANNSVEAAQGVFYGYDFHLNDEGVHLIEINTNAGGAFLNALLQDSQRHADLPGTAVAMDDLDAVFVEMFRSECPAGPLKLVAILDEQPETQFLYPEFKLAQQMFERAGIRAFIADPAQLTAEQGLLYVDGQKIDLIYNRLTDFSLEKYPLLRDAWQRKLVVLTPNPDHYARYADKRHLAFLTDAEALRRLEVSAADIETLMTGIPRTFIVQPELEETLWGERKQLFFKPCSGFGSRGAYRGDKLTRRVYGEILQSDYVAQQLASPGERCISEGVSLKYDVRCYVYNGEIQLLAARLYQGQTTNFRTSGGGFAPVRVIA